MFHGITWSDFTQFYKLSYEYETDCLLTSFEYQKKFYRDGFVKIEKIFNKNEIKNFYFVKETSIHKLKKHWSSGIGSFNKQHIFDHKSKRFKIEEEDIDKVFADMDKFSLAAQEAKRKAAEEAAKKKQRSRGEGRQGGGKQSQKDKLGEAFGNRDGIGGYGSSDTGMSGGSNSGSVGGGADQD